MKRIKRRKPDGFTADNLATKKDYELKICTWNVRTLHRPGALIELKSVLKIYGADITAIQEIRWIGSDIRKEKECDV